MAAAPLFVVPVEFAPEMEATVSAALALARRCEARVHLLQVVSPPALPGDRADFRLSGRTTPTGDWSRLEGAIHAAESADVDVRVVAYRGDPIAIVASYAQLTKARLLVIGRHYGTSRWRRSPRIVSTLSRSAPAPVLVLPPRPQPDKSRPFAHIVSAVDFTVASAVAVRTVLGLVRRTGARLTLVHVLKEGPHPMIFSGSEAGRVARTLKGQIGEAAKQLRKRIPAAAGLRVDARVTSGTPHQGLLDVAAEVKADLIVMGVPPRTRFDEIVTGSTLRKVLRRADIPVLVFPVPAGAHEWLEEPDAVATVATSRRSRERRP
jgi:nucleotide-binding universal stress UspA family protein